MLLPTQEASDGPEDVRMEEATAALENVTEATTEPSATVGSISKPEVEVINGILKRFSEYQNENGREVFHDFQRQVNKRQLPDYHDIIKESVAFSTVRGKITKKLYKDFKEFIRDMALISHNAQVYNKPKAQVFKDAITLQAMFKAELQKLVEEQFITAERAVLPDLGEIPEVEESPPPVPGEEEEAEEEEEEDEEDEEDEDTDEERPRRGRKKARRSSGVVTKKAEDGVKEDPEAQKKRGRPPKVHTPMEARINTLLKGLRKFKNPGGELKILHFEKLPDKAVMPEYYQEIKTPIAMDLIKRKAKRKKYNSVDATLKDLEIMFENAKEYNLEDSQVYRDALDLQRESRLLAEQEKKKPDSDFVDEDGRFPLPEIVYNGQTWKVGDWIHLTNPNDVTKPIVAQIYRTWQDPEGQKWINACWYYRPEQTVHRYEKHFFENEVVKTGQYRDHKIEEVIDRCFVMFFTRYNKGRPRGFPRDKEVYVCEARYNEEKFKLNKIKTWASCVPDEVREKDYEMDLFDAPRKMKKVPSPIKHLLREDAKEDDPLPKPTWGAPNAPPIVGAVHKRPREANESPPPEPTPSPPPPEPERPHRPVMSDRLRYDTHGDVSMSGTSTITPLAPQSGNQSSNQNLYGQQFPPPGSPAQVVPHTTSYSSRSSIVPSASPATPQYQHQTTFPFSSTPQNAIGPSSQSASYANYQSASHPRPAAPMAGAHSASSANAYNPPRPSEVYTLPEAANAQIPVNIRSEFRQDGSGNVLFFTVPPLVKSPPEDGHDLGHTIRYLADKARNTKLNEETRKAHNDELERMANERLGLLISDKAAKEQLTTDQRAKTVSRWSLDVNKGTDRLYQIMHGDEWQQRRTADIDKIIAGMEEGARDKQEIEDWDAEIKKREEVPMWGWRL